MPCNGQQAINNNILKRCYYRWNNYKSTLKDTRNIRNHLKTNRQRRIQKRVVGIWETKQEENEETVEDNAQAITYNIHKM